MCREYFYFMSTQLLKVCVACAVNKQLLEVYFQTPWGIWDYYTYGL